MKLAGRLDQIEPFYVMECAKAAAEMARSPVCDPALGGRRMLYLNIGEPDFTAPELVREAAQQARQGTLAGPAASFDHLDIPCSCNMAARSTHSPDASCTISRNARLVSLIC